MSGSVLFQPISGLPLVEPGDDLARLLVDGLGRLGLSLQGGDILVLAQKIVSKSEGQLVNLRGIEPSDRARQIGQIVGKDPRLVEVILGQSREIVWVSPGIFVVETHHGFVCANAGVDRSNIAQPEGGGGQEQKQEGSEENEWVCLLPLDPNASAARLRDTLRERTGTHIAVLINDTHGRPFRMGGVGVALGTAGLVGLADQKGQSDLFGYRLRNTLTAVGDELASAASLLMGQAAEATPAVLVRGLLLAQPDPAHDLGATDLIRPANRDVFRYPPGSEQWRM